MGQSFLIFYLFALLFLLCCLKLVLLGANPCFYISLFVQGICGDVRGDFLIFLSSSLFLARAGNSFVLVGR